MQGLGARPSAQERTYCSAPQIRRLSSGRAHTLTSMPSRNESCPCGSGQKYKRCCLAQLGVVARELRERDAFLGDLTAWLRAEHAQTLEDAGSHTTLIR